MTDDRTATGIGRRTHLTGLGAAALAALAGCSGGDGNGGSGDQELDFYSSH